MWLVCLPLAYFFVQLTRDVPIRSGKAVAAAYGWYGESGTVTVTHGKTVVQDGGKRRNCYGDFRPNGEGATVVGVRVHLSGTCKDGRRVTVRLLRRDTRSRLIQEKENVAYAGTGGGKAIVVGLLMGAFCLVVGGPFVLCAVVFPFLLLGVCLRRRGVDRRARAD